MKEVIKTLTRNVKEYQKYLELLNTGSSVYYDCEGCSANISYDQYNGGMGYDREFIPVSNKAKLNFINEVRDEVTKKLFNYIKALKDNLKLIDKEEIPEWVLSEAENALKGEIS